MPNKKHMPAGNLQVRRYSTPLAAGEFNYHIDRIVHGEPLFNLCFLTQERLDWMRIGGTELHGDIAIRHSKLPAENIVTVEFRNGDTNLADKIAQILSNELEPAPPRTVSDDDPFENLAHFLETLKGCKLKRKIIITDSAIESGLECAFDEYDEVVQELHFLSIMESLARHPGFKEHKDRPRYIQAKRRHNRPIVALHDGAKVQLAQRIHIRSAKYDNVLRIHFAELPRNRYLIGYVDEYCDVP